MVKAALKGLTTVSKLATTIATQLPSAAMIAAPTLFTSVQMSQQYEYVQSTFQEINLASLSDSSRSRQNLIAQFSSGEQSQLAQNIDMASINFIDLGDSSISLNSTNENTSAQEISQQITRSPSSSEKIGRAHV